MMSLQNAVPSFKTGLTGTGLATHLDQSALSEDRLTGYTGTITYRFSHNRMCKVAHTPSNQNHRPGSSRLNRNATLPADPYAIRLNTLYQNSRNQDHQLMVKPFRSLRILSPDMLQVSEMNSDRAGQLRTVNSI
jgi:hypothetical protein